MFELILSFLLPWITGSLIAMHLIRDSRLCELKLIAVLALGGGLGFGMASCIAYMWLMIIGSLKEGYVLFEILLFFTVICGTAIYLKSDIIKLFKRKASQSRRIQPVNWFIGIVFAFVLIIALLTFIEISIEKPLGGGDGLLIFNTHARFIFRGGDNWTDMFLVEWNHPDYPLMIPILIARGWVYTGQEANLVPVLIHLYYILATVGVLVTTLFILQGPLHGLLAGIVLLSTPLFIYNGACQYADIPLGYYYLCSLILLYFDKGALRKIGFFAGLMAAMAAWVKNEGMLFLFVVLIAHFISRFREAGFRNTLVSSYHIIISASPVLAIVLYFKIQLAPPTDLLTYQNVDSLKDHLLDIGRYADILKQLTVQIYYHTGSHLILLLIVFLLMGLSVKKMRKTKVRFVFLVCLMMMMSYFITYVITPLPLHWHLLFSSNRLFLQLWPILLYLCFLVVRLKYEKQSVKTLCD